MEGGEKERERGRERGREREREGEREGEKERVRWKETHYVYSVLYTIIHAPTSAHIRRNHVATNVRIVHRASNAVQMKECIVAGVQILDILHKVPSPCHVDQL